MPEIRNWVTLRSIQDRNLSSWPFLVLRLALAACLAPARPCGGPGGAGVGWVLPGKSLDATQHINCTGLCWTSSLSLHEGFGALSKAQPHSPGGRAPHPLCSRNLETHTSPPVFHVTFTTAW